MLLLFLGMMASWIMGVSRWVVVVKRIEAYPWELLLLMVGPSLSWLVGSNIGIPFVAHDCFVSWREEKRHGGMVVQFRDRVVAYCGQVPVGDEEDDEDDAEGSDVPYSIQDQEVKGEKREKGGEEPIGVLA